jgi:hypothetical protein
MAAQAALIADTITGMKRALRREREGMLFLTYSMGMTPLLKVLFSDSWLGL